MSEETKVVSGTTPAFDIASGTRLRKWMHSTVGTYAYDVENREYSVAMPGFAVIEWMPTMGYSDGVSSALNKASDATYTFVTSGNNRLKTYQGVDIQLTLSATDAIYSAYNTVCRVIGLIKQYNIYNLYKPKAIVEALGFDYDDFRHNFSDLIQDMEVLANTISTLPLPNTHEVFERHSMWNSVIFRDGEGEKAQLYVFRQKYFFDYEVVDNMKGLTPKMFPAKCTAKQAIDFINGLISHVKLSDSYRLITADVLKAYGKENMCTVTVPTVDYKTEIIENYSILAAIHNADFAVIKDASGTEGDSADFYDRAEFVKSFRVYDKNDGTGVLYCQPQSWVSPVRTYVLDTWGTDNPDAAAIDNLMTFKIRWTYTKEKQRPALTGAAGIMCPVKGSLVAFGTEVLNDIIVYAMGPMFMAADTDDDRSPEELESECTAVASYAECFIAQPSERPGLVMIDSITDNPAVWKLVAGLTSFDWHPLIWCYLIKSDATTRDKCRLIKIGDISNYAILTPNQIETHFKVKIMRTIAGPSVALIQK